MKKASKAMKQTPNVSYNKEKFKKFSYLKYKPNSITETPQPTKHKTGFQKTYASAVQGTNNTNINVSISHKSNNNDAENKSHILLSKLKILNLDKQLQSCGKSLSRSTSKTRQKPSPRDKEIENPKNKTQILTVSNQQYH